MAKSAVNAVLNTSYDGKIKSDDVKDVMSKGINTAAKKCSGFKEGSAEAIAHMAKIRRLRKTQKGEGILDDIMGAIIVG